MHCSIESMKVWGKVSMENGNYKLHLDVTTHEASIKLEGRTSPRPKATQRPVLSSGDQDPEDRTINASMVDAARERATGAEKGILTSSASSSKFPSPSCRSFFSKNHRHESKDALSVRSNHAIPCIKTNTRHQKAPKHRRGKGQTSLFVTVKNNTRVDDVPQWSLSVVQLFFRRAKLHFGKMTLGHGLRPFAFVEMDSVDYGNKAIGLLNGRYKCPFRFLPFSNPAVYTAALSVT
ncbi:hypothetical protein RvY_11627 [Ramazzottius varieornatus]|uniref:RRM domain-containing protein n=1 Tax=Ramazzottius varieornatus TaxID=947166 RepID=A0A1D1VL25_RAMVA|nr:hypothetical protein RvY_11627 [Ramazzottius varieornatus]